MSNLGFTMTEPDRFQCDTCGEVVPSGIISISDHFCKCAGKGMFDNIEKIYKSDLDAEGKKDLALLAICLDESVPDLVEELEEIIRHHCKVSTYATNNKNKNK
jgi:hypothetical protein